MPKEEVHVTVRAGRRCVTAEVQLVKRLDPGTTVTLNTTGWGSNRYKGAVVAFVPAGRSLKAAMPEGAKISAVDVSSLDRYVVKVTDECRGPKQNVLFSLANPKYFAPIASRLENDNT